MKNITSARPVSTKHIAQRTCVACRKIKAKRELIRLVRMSSGNIEIDSGGKEVGRGAYLCRAWNCWETALKGNRLEHALKSNLARNNREQLIERGKDLLQGVS